MIVEWFCKGRKPYALG